MTHILKKYFLLLIKVFVNASVGFTFLRRTQYSTLETGGSNLNKATTKGFEISCNLNNIGY